LMNAVTSLDMLQLCPLSQVEDHQPNATFQWEGAPHTGIVLSKNPLTCLFLGAGFGSLLRIHPILRRLISSCGNTLRALFTRPCDVLRWTEAQNCCCDWSCYTANAGEDLDILRALTGASSLPFRR
jgi:hypothetical protein